MTKDCWRCWTPVASNALRAACEPDCECPCHSERTIPDKINKRRGGRP